MENNNIALVVSQTIITHHSSLITPSQDYLTMVDSEDCEIKTDKQCTVNSLPPPIQATTPGYRHITYHITRWTRLIFTIWWRGPEVLLAGTVPLTLFTHA